MESIGPSTTLHNVSSGQGDDNTVQFGIGGGGAGCAAGFRCSPCVCGNAEGKCKGEAMSEHCIAVLYALSSGGSVLRFKGMAKAAGAMDVLKEVAERGKSERAREKAKRMMMMLKGKGDATAAAAAAVEGIVGGAWEDEGEWSQEDEGELDSIAGLRQRRRLKPRGKIVSSANSTDF